MEVETHFGAVSMARIEFGDQESTMIEAASPGPQAAALFV